MNLRPRFWGSTAALVLGVVSIISGLSGPQRFSTLIAGSVVVIGSLVYRSAKRAKLGLVKLSSLRSCTEALGIVAVLAIVGLQRDLLDLIYEDPVPNLIIPLWVLIAYSIAKSGTPRTASSVQEFTVDQLVTVKELVAKEVKSFEKGRQEIINEGAKKGVTISTERVLKHVYELKSTYDGPNREQFVQEIDRFIHEFREKHGPEIPVDKGYEILKEIEQKYGKIT